MSKIQKNVFKCLLSTDKRVKIKPDGDYRQSPQVIFLPHVECSVTVLLLPL